MSEEINFDEVEFGEPIEEREPTYRDGFIRGIYRARNIIDSKQKEIERLNNIINELEKELDLNLPFKVVGVRHLKNKLQELKGVDKE